jgi:hypothetical protein
VLDAAAVEGGDRLKLVERHREAPPAIARDARREIEDLLGEARDVAPAARVRKGDLERTDRGTTLQGRRGNLVPDLGPDAAQQLPDPGSGPVRPCLDRDQRARESLEEGDVGAVAGDRDLDRQRARARAPAQRVPDERRLTVSAWRDEEDLLAVEQIAPEAVELRLAVDERRHGRNLAVDERVPSHAAIRSST